MSRKITQQEFIILFFSIVSVFTLFVPFPKLITYPAEGTLGVNPGNFYHEEFNLPWRSYDQLIILNLTIVDGNLTIIVLNEDGFYAWIDDRSFQPYYQTENVTDRLLVSIQFNPPLVYRMVVIYIPFENSRFQRELKINYTFFHTNYGIFFLSIVLIVGTRYVYNKIKYR